MSAILDYDLDFLRAPFAEAHPEYAGQFDEAATELKKFFVMADLVPGPLAVMSKAVDHLWHVFIWHTPQYEAFCNEAYDGLYLHHQPRSEAFPVPPEAISNFYSCYPEQFFQEVPSIWFDDIPAPHVVSVMRGQVPDDVLQLRWSGWPGWGN